MDFPTHPHADEVQQFSDDLALAFLQEAGKRKAPVGLTLDALVTALSAALRLYKDPELRAQMTAKAREAVLLNLDSLKEDAN